MNEQIKNDEVEIDLLELFHIYIQNAWIIIMCFVIGASLAFGGTKLLITPQYEASSMLYILSNKKSISSYLDVQIGQQLTVDFQTLAETRTVVENVINEMQLDTTYEELKQSITVSNPSGTQILKIAVRNQDPILAKDIANAMASETANRIASVMVTDKPTTVDKAVTPDKPVSPSTAKNTAIGGLLGAIIAMAFLTIKMLLNDTIVTKDDVEKYLGLTVLASVPTNKLGKGSHSRKRRR